jgi:hypothetical protein
MSNKDQGLSQILLEQKKPIATVKTSIGEFTIYRAIGKDISALASFYENPKNQTNCRSLIEQLIQRICFPSEKLQTDELRPEEQYLNRVDTAQLAETDLEKIATKYINNDLEFTRKTNWKANEEGGLTGKIENQAKPDNVTYAAFLCEMLTKKIERTIQETEQYKKFSHSLQEDIRTNSILGNSLLNHIKASKAILKAEAELSATASVPQKVVKDPIDFNKLAIDTQRKQQENFERPFKELSEKLNSLIILNEKGIEHSINSNDIQNNIASEIIESSKTTDGHAKKTILLSYIVIFLTVFSLVFTAWSNYSGVTFSEDQNKILNEFATNINRSITQNSYITSEDTSTTNAILNELVTELKRTNQYLNSNNQAVEQKMKTLEIKFMQANERIEFLEAELEKQKSK